jgi:hypothetical protein
MATTSSWCGGGGHFACLQCVIEGHAPMYLQMAVVPPSGRTIKKIWDGDSSRLFDNKWYIHQGECHTLSGTMSRGCVGGRR